MNAIESVTIVGSKDDLAGAASVVSNEDLEKMIDTDIQKILKVIYSCLHLLIAVGYLNMNGVHLR